MDVLWLGGVSKKFAIKNNEIMTRFLTTLSQIKRIKYYHIICDATLQYKFSTVFYVMPEHYFSGGDLIRTVFVYIENIQYVFISSVVLPMK